MTLQRQRQKLLEIKAMTELDSKSMADKNHVAMENAWDYFRARCNGILDTIIDDLDDAIADQERNHASGRADTFLLEKE